ncbi:hypothetical protein GCM10007276_08660 [Agaricicola taiwanensis]|uniref:Uncharacterized protein n=1 Tax=Agaricicola taiwanensis TaxID=591372 RepID=A0A8J2YFN9_9RHOB|nr:hypothetical protein [Agaricicola taiwanensis]GGE33617.1 hypothetical protein GCM10007276_08660 [Agaricicola taiwanensis]
MEYSDDILSRIQAALIDFHAATHTNGRKRTWSVIARELYNSAIDSLDSDDDGQSGDPYKALAEALRRFAAGSQTPSKERLDALCSYLKSKSFLTDADLRPAEVGSPLVHALTAFFGGDEERNALAVVAGRFAASRKLPSGRTELSVVTVRNAGVRVPIVEDKLYSLPAAPQSVTRDALARVLKRLGGSEQRYDGWLFHKKGQTCLVVQDSLRGEPAIYTVLDRKVAAGDIPAVILLVKSRDFGAPAPGYEKGRMSLVPDDASTREMAFSKIKERIWEYRQEGDPDAQ